MEQSSYLSTNVNDPRDDPEILDHSNMPSVYNLPCSTAAEIVAAATYSKNDADIGKHKE